MAPKANNASAGVGRAKTDVTDSQIGFIEFIVLPIWFLITLYVTTRATGN